MQCVTTGARATRSFRSPGSSIRRIGYLGPIADRGPWRHRAANRWRSNAMRGTGFWSLRLLPAARSQRRTRLKPIPWRPADLMWRHPMATRAKGRQSAMTGEGTAPRLGFRRPAPKAAVPASPEALFGALPRLPFKHGALWSHQADMLRKYHEECQSTADVALELGTGSGKTLVGMLIAEWRRRARAERVIYACPTRQLAIQAHAAARNQGIDAVLLIGPSREWDTRDVAGYTKGERVAVTVYSHIFNISPKLEVAGTVLFDD